MVSVVILIVGYRNADDVANCLGRAERREFPAEF